MTAAACLWCGGPTTILSICGQCCLYPPVKPKCGCKAGSTARWCADHTWGPIADSNGQRRSCPCGCHQAIADYWYGDGGGSE